MSTLDFQKPEKGIRDVFILQEYFLKNYYLDKGRFDKFIILMTSSQSLEFMLLANEKYLTCSMIDRLHFCTYKVFKSHLHSVASLNLKSN